MGLILGRYSYTTGKKVDLNFFFSIFFCIFALGGIRFGEYGHISAIVLHILFINLISIIL